MAHRDDDCIADILKAIGDRGNRRHIEENLEDLDARMQADDGPGTTREKYERAAREMLEEHITKTSILKRNIRMDALKARDLRNFVAAAPTPRLGIEASLVGVNAQFFDPKSRRGNQQSAAAIGHGAQKDWIGGAVTDLERAAAEDPKYSGLDKLFYSRKIEDQIFLEKIELEKGIRGNLGVTKNEQAQKIAEVLVKWDKVKIEALNSQGAWIEAHSTYGAMTSHDPDKLRKASNNRAFRKGFEDADRQQWVNDVELWIDPKRMFGARADEARDILRQMYGGLVTGDHMQPILIGDDFFPNLARKVSQHRSFQWKDGESWLAYMKKYGRFAPTEAWLHTMRRSANDYGLLTVFGSKPREGFETIMAEAKNMTMGTEKRLELEKWETALDNRFKVVSGEADRPVPSMAAGLMSGVMAVQRMAKLGLTPFAMLQDNVTISRELARQGVSAIERWSPLFSGYFRGAEGTEKQQVAALLHTGILGRLRNVTARFDVADDTKGVMAKLENTFFKITGITPMTENKRADAERMMAYHMGQQREKAYADLGGAETRTLQSFGIGDKEWDLLKKAKWTEIEGETYLTPDVATRIPDADITAYLKERGTIADRAAAASFPNAAMQMVPAAEETIARARNDLAHRLWAYYSERGHFSVLEVGARERAMLYQGTQANTPLNLALRMLLQFKQFPTAMVTKAWGAEIYGGAKTMDKIAGVAELAVVSTVFGMLANSLNALAKGQDPFAQARNQPAQFVISGFLRGGAASIYGDFLLGEWSRFGLSAAATLLGPAAGQIDRVAELWSDLTHLKEGRKAGALGVRMVRENLPFMNMIYTKAAFDYLVFYRLQEYINPGYLDRMERTMKEKQGQEFLLRPSQVSR